MAEQKELDLEDKNYISWLPDELILIILSKLDFSNEARTTILSTRWRNLWTFPTTVLRFDASDMIPSDTDYFQCYHHSMAKNIKLEHIVDQTLAQYTVMRTYGIRYFSNQNHIVPIELIEWIIVAYGVEERLSRFSHHFHQFRRGCLNRIRTSLRYMCPAEHIPDKIEVDVSNLDIGDSVSMQDVMVHTSLKLISKNETMQLVSKLLQLRWMRKLDVGGSMRMIVAY
ncbi:hypothetical protein OROMI_027313 [Orobanche minor]